MKISDKIFDFVSVLACENYAFNESFNIIPKFPYRIKKTVQDYQTNKYELTDILEHLPNFYCRFLKKFLIGTKNDVEVNEVDIKNFKSCVENPWFSNSFRNFFSLFIFNLGTAKNFVTNKSDQKVEIKMSDLNKFIKYFIDKFVSKNKCNKQKGKYNEIDYITKKIPDKICTLNKKLKSFKKTIKNTGMNIKNNQKFMSYLLIYKELMNFYLFCLRIKLFSHFFELNIKDSSIFEIIETIEKLERHANKNIIEASETITYIFLLLKNWESENVIPISNMTLFMVYIKIECFTYYYRKSKDETIIKILYYFNMLKEKIIKIEEELEKYNKKQNLKNDYHGSHILPLFNYLYVKRILPERTYDILLCFFSDAYNEVFLNF